MFLAQMGTESSGYIRLVENLNYAADKLVGVFGDIVLPSNKRIGMAAIAITKPGSDRQYRLRR